MRVFPVLEKVRVFLVEDSDVVVLERLGIEVGYFSGYVQYVADPARRSHCCILFIYNLFYSKYLSYLIVMQNFYSY